MTSIERDVFVRIINKFKDDSEPEQRYSSFDYCYNYFKTGKNLTDDMEKSCLVLGFYLASWGMYRGSSFILQKSVKHFEEVIIYIDKLKKEQPELWEIDVDSYDVNIPKIIDIYNHIKSRIIVEGKTHLTLVTKVMLGVFGFIPAFDNYFTNTFREMFKESDNCGFRSVNKKSLNCIKQFYEDNKIIIDKLQNETFTTNFSTGKKTDIRYTKAKLIDMYGFTVGIRG
jgi:hypothetical protein